jgi:hypothetical protein
MPTLQAVGPKLFPMYAWLRINSLGEKKMEAFIIILILIGVILLAVYLTKLVIDIDRVTKRWARELTDEPDPDF